MLAPICRYHPGGDQFSLHAVPPFGETASMIAVEHLTRTFGALTVLDGLSFAIEPGERVALFGPNGSGKSTLLRCVLGTVTPTAGTVTVGGHRAGTFSARSLIGVSLAQERSFYLRLSGRENLILFARLRGLSRRAAASRVERAAAGAGAGRGRPQARRSLLDRPATAARYCARVAGGASGAAARRAHALARPRCSRSDLGGARPPPRPCRRAASHLDADIELCDRVIRLSATPPAVEVAA